MNYQESQWLIPLGPDRTLLCNCWEGFPREGLLAIFAANPGETWVCREADPGLGSASCSFPAGDSRPAVMGISGGPCSFRLKRQTHPLCCLLLEITHWSLPPLELYKFNSELFELEPSWISRVLRQVFCLYIMGLLLPLLLGYKC